MKIIEIKKILDDLKFNYESSNEIFKEPHNEEEFITMNPCPLFNIVISEIAIILLAICKDGNKFKSEKLVFDIRDKDEYNVTSLIKQLNNFSNIAYSMAIQVMQHITNEKLKESKK